MANEKRLIDANELEAHFHETKMIAIFPYWKELPFDTQCELVRFGKALKKMMQNAPTVDAVEVVRCKDCKHYDKDALWCNINSPMFSEEHYNWYEDDFCSIGEKQMDGDGNE